MRRPTTLPSYNQLYALLLTAHESNRRLWLEMSSADTDCTLSYVVSDK
ncbi:hypothetical protein GGQ98_003603 [Sphingosinicella soli]|uniref:Uncharacterized protein n=1 Tax=Sphingosinicella soli TaxID=333708 RepID=A0A7W7B6I9_9SPHN|nr:hypothetical protein [Sphingosinicella soli]